MTGRSVRIAVGAIVACLVSGWAAADVGYRGWGPRVGLSDDPDQIVGGVHFDLGEFSPHVRLQPSVEVGFGDHVNSLLGNIMVSYYFQPQKSVTPYAGGQLTAAFFDPDRGDSETEIGIAAIGGIETRLKGGTRFLAEIQLGFGDIPDVKLMAGWTFK